MSSFTRLFAAYFASPLPWLSWAVVSSGLAVSGPFGSYEAFPLPVRLLFWSTVVAMTLVPGLALRAWLGALNREMRPGILTLAALLCGLLVVPVWVLLHLGLREAASQPDLVEVAAVVFCASLGIGLFRPGSPPQDKAPLPRLLQRMEPADRGDLISISVRDHYVDIVTSAGPSSLLMRFSDAISETEGIPGDQIHRSHWVAWDAVIGVEQAEGKTWVSLRDGSRLPVSRAHLPKLEARDLV